MLVVIPEQPFGRLGALLSALIVVASLIGLTVHKDFYARRRRRDFYSYYTNLSNLFVLLYFALVAPALYGERRLHSLIPHVEFSLMMSIMLTFTVFHHLLLPGVLRTVKAMPRGREFAILFTDNLIVHYLVPWLVLAYWLLCAPGKMRLRAYDALLWTAIPLVYLAYIFVRARVRGNIEEIGSPYPYPFLNVAQRGISKVAGTCTLLYAACVGVALAIVALTQLSFSCFGGGHAFLLI